MPASARPSHSPLATRHSPPPVSLVEVLSDDLLQIVIGHCSEDETALRALYATFKSRALRAVAANHLRRLLCIALVGPTPDNESSQRLGIFVKRPELVNGWPSYSRVADDKCMLWHCSNGSDTCWLVGKAANVGQSRGHIRVIDGCLVPEMTRKTWQVCSKARKWVDAPELRCLDGAALASELEKAAPRIALLGPTPDNLRAGLLGIFVKRPELVNSYPSYTHVAGAKYMLWHFGSCWFVGNTADVGQARGLIRVVGGCLFPETSRRTWEVWNMASEWVDAPELRCLDGASLASELEKAAPRIALTGPTPDNLRAGLLGVFMKRPELVNGYPSYAKLGDDKHMLWHSVTCWFVGKTANVGQSIGFVRVMDGCLSPEMTRRTWEVWNNKASEWVDAPELRCLAGYLSPSQRIWDVVHSKWSNADDFYVFDDARH